LKSVSEAPPASSSPLPGPYQELRMLSAGTEARQSQIRQVLIDLEGVHKRLEELQCTIQIKVTWKLYSAVGLLQLLLTNGSMCSPRQDMVAFIVIITVYNS
jgi:hypothetical protein